MPSLAKVVFKGYRHLSEFDGWEAVRKARLNMVAGHDFYNFCYPAGLFVRLRSCVRDSVVLVEARSGQRGA